MDTLFGGQSGIKVVLFVIVVLGLLALAFWLLRRFGGGGLVSGATRGRHSRLAVIDQATVDSRRRLVLIRRDTVEHLLIIGGPSDVVVEQNIVRAATALRETGPARPPPMPRAPVGEDSMWPLQPELAPPGTPAPRKARTADPLAHLADELSRVPRVGEPTERRRPPPLQPAPPARSTAHAALKPAAHQNRAEMAQRLEAALRRPAKSSNDASTAAGIAPEPFTAAPSSGRLDRMLRRPSRANEPRAVSGVPKAPSEPAAPPREPDTQGRGDDKAPSEPAAPPRELDTQGRGDDKAPSKPAAPPRELDTQGRGDDKAPSEPAAPPREPNTQGHGDDKAARKPATPPREPDTQGRDDDKAAREPAVPPREPDTQGRGDDGYVTNDRPWRLADLSFVPSGNGREKATINGVEVMKENGRYWIITPNGPLWSNIDERGVDPALNYLFEKQRQER
jgi:flagellar protein FliO/FliZ